MGCLLAFPVPSALLHPTAVILATPGIFPIDTTTLLSGIMFQPGVAMAGGGARVIAVARTCSSAKAGAQSGSPPLRGNKPLSRSRSLSATRHPDERQDPEPEEVPFVTLGPDFRQDDGRRVGGGDFLRTINLPSTQKGPGSLPALLNFKRQDGSKSRPRRSRLPAPAGLSPSRD